MELGGVTAPEIETEMNEEGSLRNLRLYFIFDKFERIEKLNSAILSNTVS